MVVILQAHFVECIKDRSKIEKEDEYTERIYSILKFSGVDEVVARKEASEKWKKVFRESSAVLLGVKKDEYINDVKNNLKKINADIEQLQKKFIDRDVDKDTFEKDIKKLNDEKSYLCKILENAGFIGFCKDSKTTNNNRMKHLFKPLIPYKK